MLKIQPNFHVTSGFLKEFSRSQESFSDFSIKMPSEEDFERIVDLACTFRKQSQALH
jgi:hypothetical protein